VTLWAVITDPIEDQFNVGGTPNIASWVALIDPESASSCPHSSRGDGHGRVGARGRVLTMTYYQPLPTPWALLAMEYVARVP